MANMKDHTIDMLAANWESQSKEHPMLTKHYTPHSPIIACKNRPLQQARPLQPECVSH